MVMLRRPSLQPCSLLQSRHALLPSPSYCQCLASPRTLAKRALTAASDVLLCPAGVQGTGKPRSSLSVSYSSTRSWLGELTLTRLPDTRWHSRSRPLVLSWRKRTMDTYIKTVLGKILYLDASSNYFVQIHLLKNRKSN